MAGVMQHYRSRWMRYFALCVLSALVFLAASLMHERALVSAIDGEIHRAVVFAEDTIGPIVKDADLRNELPAAVAATLDGKLERDVLTGSSVVRLRIFAREGTLIYSTDDGDRLGTRSAGDMEAVRAAADGRTTGFEDSDRVSNGGETQSLRLLSTYVPLSAGAGADAVLSVDQRYRPIQDATSQPWRALQLVGLAGAVVFLELFLLWLARHISAARLASRSGFQPMAGTPDRAKSDKDLRAEEKQAKVREALEQQLETLRAQVAGHDEETAAMRASYEERIRDAEHRLAKAASSGDAGMLQTARDRAAQAERDLGRAESRLSEAEARVAELVAEVRMLQDKAAPGETGADPEAVRRLREQVETLTRSAGEHEERSREALAALKEQEQAAASVDAARAELDARLATEIAEHQVTRSKVDTLETELAELRTVAGDAADLAREGARQLEEATAAGDVARTELTRTTNERDELARRVAELEETLAESVRTAEELAASLDHERGRLEDADAERTALQEDLATVKRARDDAEHAVGDAEARAQAAESRLAAAASDLSTEAATLAAELDAERQRVRSAEERLVEAERRGDEMDRHASSLAQALEDERVQRDQARAEVAELGAELERLKTGGDQTQELLAQATAALEAQTARTAELEGLVRDAEATQERMQAELAATQERTQGEMAEALQRAKDEAASAQEAAREALAAAQQAAQEELAVHQLRAQEELTAVRDELAAAQEQLQQAATAATGEMTEIQARLASLETANAELTQANAELTRANEDLTRRSEEMMQAADGAQQRVADATTAVAATQEEREGLRTRVVELEAQLERASSEMAALASRPEAAPPASNDGDDLRRQNETLREELESMGMRLRRAYADAEDARAQLAVMPANPGPLAAMGGPASADGLDEIHRLRLELGRAVERADAAEARVARLQEAAGQPQAEGEETGVPDEERSLRFRLAKTAARKKGIDAPSSGQGGGSGSMWS